MQAQPGIGQAKEIAEFGIEFNATVLGGGFLRPGSGLIRSSNKSRVIFDGLEVRAVGDLSHLDENTLRAMVRSGFAPKNRSGQTIILHHLDQNPAGPVCEMPAYRHCINNPVQHPKGNAAGAGLTAEERAAFNKWREDYWRARAEEELRRRGL